MTVGAAPHRVARRVVGARALAQTYRVRSDALQAMGEFKR